MSHVLAWPVGQSRYTGRPWQRLMYGLAAAVGGAALGVVLAALIAGASLLPRQFVSTSMAFVIFLSALAELSGRPGIFPERRAQVPSEWLSRGPIWYAPAFGLALGAGALTRLYHPALYAMAAGVVALGDPVLAVSMGLLFGGLRGIVPLVPKWVSHAGGDVVSVFRLFGGRRVQTSVRVTLTLISLVLFFQLLHWQSSQSV